MLSSLITPVPFVIRVLNMKQLVLLADFGIIFLFPASVYGQQDLQWKGPERTISGTLYYTSFSQGGAYVPDRDMEPEPLVNTLFYVVRVTGGDSIPEVVQSFTTNENGYFRVDLPAGIYGIVTAGEKDQLAPGVYFPEDAESGDQWQGSTTRWLTNRTFPLDLTAASVEDLVITSHYSAYCYRCP
jgi:hypothetical protein